ncbi:MAG: mannose-6-phosphate isomerase, class I [Candidatus Marinimicrobia bacterium]|nr:mannose-6-phosphate isomerase, class I [Candidatus Neomarinimicrobiota bacterium]
MKILKIQPYLLENEIQHYAWGQKNDEAFIPKLIGITPQNDLPYAELWIGAHPKAPSKLIDTDLLEMIHSFPEEILGEKATARFRGNLPFLMKVLTAGEALSIQAHPNKAQAEILHEKDPENYPDNNHKPEIAIALDDLTALVGFRTIREMLNVLDNYPPIGEFVSPELLKGDNERESLKAFYTEIMTKAESNPDELELVLVKMDELISLKNEKSEADEFYIELRQKYGTDVGLFSLYFFNLLHLSQGEAVFLSAGIPHAYLKGNIIECMANSDNVVRAGLTPKFKDISTLVDILTYDTGLPIILQEDKNSYQTEYKVPVPDFAILMKKLKPGKEIKNFGKRLEIFIITEGQIHIQSGDFSDEYQKGDALLIPAALNCYKITATEPATLFSAIIPEN